MECWIGKMGTYRRGTAFKRIGLLCKLAKRLNGIPGKYFPRIPLTILGRLIKSGPIRSEHRLGNLAAHVWRSRHDGCAYISFSFFGQ